MKLKTLLSLLPLLASALFQPLHAEKVKVGNFFYELDPTSNTAAIVNDNSYSSLTGNLTIPAKITYNGSEYPVTEIADDAFRNCSINGTLTIPNSITKIGAAAFLSCRNLKGDIIIPENVTYIGASAFYDCVGFTGSVIIKGALTTIEEKVFQACNNITKITIPSSVKEIKAYAFDGCKSVTSMTIPEGVQIIGQDAFASLRALSGKLTIPKSVTSIGVRAFADMQNTTEFEVASGNTKYVSVNGILYDKNKTILIACPAGLDYKNRTLYDIPSTVVEIGDYALWWCHKFIGDVILSNNITKIGSHAFYDCRGLTGDLYISNVTDIGSYAFYGCSNLDGRILLNRSLKTIPERAFLMCNNLKGPLKLPESLTTIEHSAFASCWSLTGDLIIPDNVNSIGMSAFSGCSSLSGTLKIPSNIIQLESGIFSGCSGLSGTLEIPNSVRSIGANCFNGCSNFKGIVTLPKNLYSIYADAFKNCYGITDFMVLNSNTPNMEKPAFDGTSAKIIVPTNTAEEFKTETGWSGYSTKIYEIGDANLSQTLNVADAVTVANDITGIQNSTFYKLCADFNSDDRISISDATGIIEAVLANTSSIAAYDAPRRVLGGKALRIDNFSTSGDVANVGVSLTGVEDMVAMQADFYPTDGMTIEGAVIAPELAATHSLSTARLENEALRVVVFSAANAPIAADVPVLTLEVTGEEGSIEAGNIYAAAADGSETRLGFYGGVATSGVSGVNEDVVSFETSANSLTICNAVGINVAICNLAGQNVMTTTMKSDCETIELPKGIYIVRIADKSHKIIIR